ncbi:MAG: glycerol-3-phosphate dehydrogenase/oxidase [Planctomycetes bacterium]|nr:glycerol-3-phosphate dehydrogenase/oxidase [Planctomycetota bacterium]
MTDVLVVGGGVMGAGIALDLAARGLETLLVERGDWAGATSSASSRLVHGGLRYLEQFELSLVRESCLERALLLRNGAGLVWPEVFHFPIFRGDRVGRAKLIAGLWLYTALATPRALGVPKRRSAAAMLERLPLLRTAGLIGGGSYLDAATDDARLTLAVVQTARREGAEARSRVELLSLEQVAGGIRAELRDHERGEDVEVHAKAAVLAGGPGTDELRARAGLVTPEPWLAPTRGSHVLVPRERLPTDGAAIFTSAVDGRVMFLIPWPRHTVIGTTDLDADPSAPPRATGDEVRYLLDSANALAPAAQLGEADVLSTWSGLRPLLAPKRTKSGEPSERSREERIEREGAVYTIAGGKLTGFRSAAEKLGATLTHDLGQGRTEHHSPTRELRLVGALGGFEERLGRGGAVPRPAWSRLKAGRPRDLDPLGIAWAARYGALSAEVRARVAAEGTDEPLDPFTLVGELDHGAREEDVLSLCDFLFRRTDLGLCSPVQPLLEPLATRLGQLRSWSAERRTSELAEAREELARRDAWRKDRP